MILSDPAIPKLDKLPDGWKRTVGALTAVRLGAEERAH